MQQIKLNIPANEKQTILSIIKTFTNHGFECYLVGGSVRDLILGHENYDYDFATNAKPDEVMRLFKKVIPTGIKHGTVSVFIGSRMFEITTYRADGKYIDGRHPESVSFSSSLKEDVCRRDFTINGLAYDLEKETLLDYVDGLADINRGIIRTIGNPMERFSEDGLRPYRACRFAARLGFIIDTDTFDAISKTLDIAKKVSIERVRDEFNKLLLADNPSVGIDYMRQAGLLELFLPELLQCYNVSQNKFHLHDIFWHSLHSCDAAPKGDLVIRLAALFHDLGKVPTRHVGEDGEATFYNHEIIGAKMVGRIMKRMRYSNEECERVNTLVANHMFHYTNEWTDGAVRRFMRKVGLDNIDDLIKLRLADRKGNGSREGLPPQITELRNRIAKIIQEENAITVRDLHINGNIIMEQFRLRPGPAIGKILNELLEIVLDDPDKNDSDFLIARAGDILAEIPDAERRPIK